MAVALPVHSPHAPMLELFNDMLFEAPVSTIDGAVSGAAYGRDGAGPRGGGGGARCGRRAPLLARRWAPYMPSCSCLLPLASFPVFVLSFLFVQTDLFLM
jgi:hypothetical protein